jgi:hypothetical protein
MQRPPLRWAAFAWKAPQACGWLRRVFLRHPLRCRGRTNLARVGAVPPFE